MQRVTTALLMLSTAVSLSVGLSAHAAETAPAKKPKKESLHDQFTGQGYGMSGCGLGSVVFGPKPGMIQVIAATLNGTGGSQTFGISSGTSNCEMPEMAMEAAAYIEVNREVVAKEAARGEGESLDGLATIYQCSDFSLFRQTLKANYGKVFDPANNSYDASRAVMQSIQSNEKLAKSCAALG